MALICAETARRRSQLAVRRIHATFAPKERTEYELMDDKPQNVPVEPDLVASIRQARVENAERADAIAEVRELEIVRLKALESALEPVVDQAPQGLGLFDLALTQSEHPRLFLDMIAFVDMAHDKRTYRFFQDTRNGRVLMAESQSADTIVAAVADYVARRLVERERAVTVDLRMPEGSRSRGGGELRRFSSDGVDIAFIDAKPQGRDLNEPILLIHGFASNHRMNWVGPRWVQTLTEAGRRVIAFDNRGHGQSQKLHAPADYRLDLMIQDAANLLAHLSVEHADVMGYSMGARIASFLAVAEPTLVRSLVLGGLGDRLVRDGGLPETIAEALEAPSLDSLVDPTQRLFRVFAEQTKSDRAALAACVRGASRSLTLEEAARINQPTLVAVGERDTLAGDLSKLVALLPRAEALSIPGRDHNLAVGDKAFKAGALDFLARRP